MALIISRILNVVQKNMGVSIFISEKISICFMSDRAKVRPKQLNQKNNFAFQNEFHERLNKEKIDSGDIGLSRIVSADLISDKNKRNVPDKNKRSVHQNRRKTNTSILKYRGEILFGIHSVYLALLQRNRQFYQLFIREADLSQDHSGALRKREIVKIAESLNIPVVTITTKDLRYLVPDSVHQGVCLDAGPIRLIEWEEDSQFISEEPMKAPLWLVLDEILDPMNVGSIIRSAYYFGVTRLFTLKQNSCKLSPTVSKASSGSLEVMNIYQLENLEEFLQARINCGWSIISTLAYTESNTSNQCIAPIINVDQFRISKPTILILGNEGRGVSPSVQKLCDAFISINPGQNLQQGIDSLNVSVAAGVILYSLMKSKPVT